MRAQVAGLAADQASIMVASRPAVRHERRCQRASERAVQLQHDVEVLSGSIPHSLPPQQIMP